MENYEVRIREKPGTLLQEIFIISKRFDGKIGLLRQKENGDLVDECFDRGAAIPPSLVLPENVISVMMVAFAEKGYKLPEESFTKGKLVATENHLKDLRTLLKLK